MSSSSTQPPSTRIKIALAFFAATLLFGPLEIGLRLLDLFPPNPGVASRLPDPVLGWRSPANGGYQNHQSEFDVDVRYNSRGFRDVEHEIARPDGVFRIVVLGDSFMEAYSVALEDSFSRQLEALASKGGRAVEVINLGVGGFGTLQAALTFDEEGRRFDPNLVLLGFYLGNDVRNNDIGLETELWAARGVNGSEKVRSRPFLVSRDAWVLSKIDYDGAMRRYRAASAGFFNQIDRTLRDHVATYRALRTLAPGLRSNGGSSPVLQRRELDAWLGVYACDPLPEYERAWGTTARILEQLARDVRSAGARLVVFSVPAMAEVVPEHRKALERNGADRDSYCIEAAAGHERLGAILDDLHVPFINLLPDFRKAQRDEGQRLFRSSDQHWGPAGHALAVEKVVEALDRVGILPAPKAVE